MLKHKKEIYYGKRKEEKTMKSFKRILSAILVVMMVMSVMPTFAETAKAATPAYTIPEGAELIFEEDFESGYDLNTNLLDASGTKTITKNGVDVLKLSQPAATDLSKTTVKVVADTSGKFNGNVLEFNNPDTANALEMYFYLAGGNAIDVTDPASKYYGKQIVIEYDAKITGNKEAKFMAFFTNNKYGYQQVSGNSLMVHTGDYASSYTHSKRNWFARIYISMSNKKSVKTILEQMDPVDSLRTYINGEQQAKGYSWVTEEDSNYNKIVKDFVGVSYAGQETWNYGKVSYVYSKFQSSAAGTPSAGCIDNVRVYAVEPAKFVNITSDTNINPEAGVKVNFTGAVNGTKEMFKVSLAKDTANAPVENAITDVVMSADKKVATVIMDSGVLNNLTDYKLWIDDDSVSANGAIMYKTPIGVLPENEWVLLSGFKTGEKFKLIDVVESIDNIVPNDPRTFEFKTTGEIKSATALLNDKAVNVSGVGSSVLSVNFSDIAEPANGVLALNIVATDDQVIEKEIPVSAVTDEISYIFNDDLNSLPEGSLLTGATSNTYTTNNFRFYTNAASFTGDAEIVKEGDNKYLKLTANGTDKISAVRMPSSEVDAAKQGKVLVIQTKYNAPKTYKIADSNNTAINGMWGGSTSPLANNFMRISNNGTFSIAQGQYNSYSKYGVLSRAHNYGASLKGGNWITMTTVVDQTYHDNKNPETFRTYVDGELIKSTLDGSNKVLGQNVYVYDLFPENYWGTYYERELYADKTSYGTIKYGVFNGTLTSFNATAGNSISFLLDDFVAFLADKFVVTDISSNKDTFLPNRHTLRVMFNSKINESELAYIKLTDETGAEITGLEKELVNDGYVINFTLPSDKVVAGKYSIVFSPYFHDAVSYQALCRNDDYKIDVTVVDYVKFTASVDNTEFNNFATGKTAKSVVEFSAPTAIAYENAKTAFKVVNDEGELIVENWTAKLADDKMSITLDFTNLPADNYTITVTDKLVDGAGYPLENLDSVVITISPKTDKIILFEEDFEDDYTVGDDWLTTAPDANKWTVITSASAVENDFVGVVDTLPEKATALSGKALRVYDSSASKKVGVRTKIGFENGEHVGIDLEAYPGKVLAYEADVYFVKAPDYTHMFHPYYNKSAAVLDNTVFGNDAFKLTDVNTLKLQGSYFERSATRGYASTMQHAHNGNNYVDPNNKRVLCVIDENNALGGTMKLYAGDKALTAPENTLLTDHPLYGQTKYDFPINTSLSNTKEINLGNFFGVSYLVNKGEYYLDNIKVYLVDAFEIESVEGASAAFNPTEDVIKFNFTNKVNGLANAKANIKLLDSNGTDCTDALALSIAEGGYQIVADIDENKIKLGDEYKIVVSPDLRDENNIGLAAKYEMYEYKSEGGTGTIDGKTYSWTTYDKNGKKMVKAFNPYLPDQSKPFQGADGVWYETKEAATSAGNASATDRRGVDFTADGFVKDREAMKLDVVFKTTKAINLYAEVKDLTVEGNAVKANVDFINASKVDANAWVVLAAYGEYSEMLECYSSDIDALAPGGIITENIEFAVQDGSKIKSIKLFIWDGRRTMKPYQLAEELYK